MSAPINLELLAEKTEALRGIVYRGAKIRVRKAMRVVDEAMDADRVNYDPDGNERRTPDHRVRIQAVGIVTALYGLNAPEKLELSGKVGLNPLDLDESDRRYLLGLVEDMYGRSGN